MVIVKWNKKVSVYLYGKELWSKIIDLTKFITIKLEAEEASNMDIIKVKIPKNTVQNSIVSFS